MEAALANEETDFDPGFFSPEELAMMGHANGVKTKLAVKHGLIEP